MKKELHIVKIGGGIIENDETLHSFLSYFSQLTGPKILVHGGGKTATSLAHKLGIEVTMVEGRRVTQAEMLDLITMVYAGKVNKTIVAQLQKTHCNAIGLSGADGNSIISTKRPVKEVDYGYVGDVKEVNTPFLQLLIQAQITPVFCALTHDNNGQLLNTNADTIASVIAQALTENYNVILDYCFELKGVLKDINDKESVIEHIDYDTYKTLSESGKIAEGMLPKMYNAFDALKNGVQEVRIGLPKMLIDTDIKYTSIHL